MARIVALTMRIVWTTRPRDVNVGIASQIFTAAGVLILFITNLVFAQRIIRAYHPFFGWSKGVTFLFRGLFVSVAAVLVMVITVTVQSFFTLDERTRRADRGVQLFCATYLAVYAFLPVPLVTLAAVIPRRTRIDKFGEGHFRTKFGLLTFTASLLAAGAIFRAVINYLPPRPVTDPAWYHSKAAYYCFNFGVELVVVYTYALTRFDKRFHIPDGSSAPGHYSWHNSGYAESEDVSRGMRGTGMDFMVEQDKDETLRGSGGRGVNRESLSEYGYDKVQLHDGPVGHEWSAPRPRPRSDITASKKRASTIRSVRSSYTGRPTSLGSGSYYSSVAGGQGGYQQRASFHTLPPAAVMEDDVEAGSRGPSELDGAVYDGATRAEDLAWMSRALVSSFSPEFDVPPLRKIPSPRLDLPLPQLPPAPPPREYPPLLAPLPLLGPEEGDHVHGWHIWPVQEEWGAESAGSSGERVQPRQ